MFHDQNALPLFLYLKNIWLYKIYDLHFPIFQIKTGNFLKLEKIKQKFTEESFKYTLYLHFKMSAEY